LASRNRPRAWDSPRFIAALIGAIIVIPAVIVTAVLTRQKSSPAPTVTPPAPASAGGPRNTYSPRDRTLVLSDPLTSPADHWVNGSGSAGTCQFRPSGLHVRPARPFGYHECTSTGSFRNFTYEVTFTFGTARSGGILFRGAPVANWYDAQYSADGEALVSKVSHGVVTDLSSRKIAVPALGSAHVIAVVVAGRDITFYVDHKRAVSAADSSFLSGWIGVYSSNTKAGGHTVFRNARVWTGK
jgi:hypothetical protein